jgi:hypothetical protein
LRVGLQTSYLSDQGIPKGTVFGFQPELFEYFPKIKENSKKQKTSAAEETVHNQSIRSHCFEILDRN